MKYQGSKDLLCLLILFIVVFSSCKRDDSQNVKQNQVKNSSKAEILEKGKQIAASSFMTLSSELKAALKEGGLQTAIKYCHTNAMKITDSLSNTYHVNIKRTSDKYRNPNNKPNSKELSVLAKFQNEKEMELIIEPFVEDISENEYHFYSPIIMNDLCLKCHGVPGETLLNEDSLYINKLYPNDLAIGYVQGDLRGMWSINFKIK